MNLDLIQFNKNAYESEDWLMSKSMVAYRILKFLIHNMDDDNSVICSNKEIEKQFSLSIDTVRISIKLLTDKQYLYPDQNVTSNVYFVNNNIAWKSPS